MSPSFAIPFSYPCCAPCGSKDGTKKTGRSDEAQKFLRISLIVGRTERDAECAPPTEFRTTGGVFLLILFLKEKLEPKGYVRITQ